MKSYEALNRCINRKTVEHAKNLQLSTSLLHKWQEPSTDFTDSGALNPLDRIEALIEKSIALGTKKEDALAPVQYLAERFGLIVIPVPEVEPDVGKVSVELLKAIEEFGDLAREASAVLRDGRITYAEFDRINREAWELIRQVAVFLQKAEMAVRK